MQMPVITMNILLEFVVTWVICFAAVATAIYMRDSVKGPNKKKTGVWAANLPALVLAIIVFSIRHIIK